MDRKRVGKSGLTLSSLTLGTLTWGLDTEAEEAALMLHTFMESGGSSLELVIDSVHWQPFEVVGALLATGLPRKNIEILIRCADPKLAARSQMMRAFNRALELLNVDNVDLLTFCPSTPHALLQETFQTVKELQAKHRASYLAIGTAPRWQQGAAWQFFQSSSTPLTAVAEPLSLLQPGLLLSEEFFNDTGLGAIAGSPLAGGALTGKYRHATPADSRAASPRFSTQVKRYLDQRNQGTIDATIRAAEGLDRSASQVALAWTNQVQFRTTTVVAPRTLSQMEHLLAQESWTLPKAVAKVLTEVALEPLIN